MTRDPTDIWDRNKTAPTLPLGGEKNRTERSRKFEDHTTQPPFEVTDAVYVSNEEILRSINEVFTASFHPPPLDLLYQTTWWFHQQITTFTVNELYSVANKGFTASGTMLYSQLLCNIEVALTYPMPLAATDFAGRSSDEKSAITRILSSVQSMAKDKLENQTGLAKGLSDSLLSFLKVTRAVIWPSESAPGGMKEAIRRLHGNTVNDNRGFFGQWHSSREELQRSLTSGDHVLAAEVYRLDLETLSHYTRPLDVISVGLPALASPFYYPDGTAAMLYGGLGFRYAHRLFLAMYENRAASGDSNVTKSLVEVPSCPRQAHSQSLFPSLPALEVAYSAYTQHMNGTLDARIHGAENVTADQLFFLTVCHTLCAVGLETRIPNACNDAVRNFPPFASAFNCPDKSPMNPETKCTIFPAR
ncbi:membrane metallo-endopeptidase-like 1 isoform X2 [Haemaphysalis longicornis]